MTLDDEFNKYQGQSVLVPGAAEADRGQCVQWADYVLFDVYGLPYVWANAIDFWNKFSSFDQLRENFNQITDGSIKKGDFVIFNQNVGSIYGHIDVAMADGTIDNFTGSDSNWGGNKTVHLVNHVGRQYVIGSLRLKGGNMATDKLTADEIAGIYQLAFDNNDYPQDLINAYTGKALGGLVTQLLSDPSYQQHKAQVNNPSGFKPYVEPQLYVKD